MLYTGFTDIGLSLISPVKKMKRILVVEDDEILIEFLNIIFTRSGYVYKAYRYTENIIPLIEEFEPDLVLLDYTLPLLNGEILCNQIKHCPKTRMLPVIIFSAHSNMFLSVGKYGCDSFIGKPFEPKYLIQKIEMHLIRAQVH